MRYLKGPLIAAILLGVGYALYTSIGALASSILVMMFFISIVFVVGYFESRLQDITKVAELRHTPLEEATVDSLSEYLVFSTEPLTISQKVLRDTYAKNPNSIDSVDAVTLYMNLRVYHPKTGSPIPFFRFPVDTFNELLSECDEAAKYVFSDN